MARFELPPLYSHSSHSRLNRILAQLHHIDVRTTTSRMVPKDESMKPHQFATSIRLSCMTARRLMSQRFGSVLLTATLFAFLVSPVFVQANTGKAQTQYKITKDVQAMAVAATAFTVLGGTQALLTYQDSLATGTLTVYWTKSPVSYPITLMCKGTQETRTELQLPKGTNVRILNQGQAALQRPDGTVVHLLMNNTIAERVTHIPLLTIISEYLNANTSVKYQGTAQVNGQNADVVTISLVPTTDPVQGPQYDSMTQTTFYLDQSTGFLDKIQYSSFGENDPNSTETIEVYFGKYQTINGMAIPFEQTTYVDGNLESDLILNAVNFNVGLLDSDFVLPQ